MSNADEIARRNLESLMAELGLTQVEVVRRAVEAGHTFDTATMSRIVHGDRSPRAHLEKLADGLGVRVGRLLDEGFDDSDDTDPVPQEPPAEGANAREG